MLFLTLLALGVAAGAGLLQIGLEYKFHDKRTRRHRQIRALLVSLLVLSAIGGGALLILDDLEQARDAMERALKVLPGRPDVFNNLGDVYRQAGDRQKALAAFERAVSLKPNYAIARFNLAEVYEAVNVRRAIAEYETYLALIEGIPEEAERAERARQRLKVLTR